MSTIFFREIDKLQEELVDSESVLDSKRKVRYFKFQSLRWVYFWLTKLLLHCCFFCTMILSHETAFIFLRIYSQLFCVS